MGLHRQVRGIVAATVVFFRFATLGMVALSVVGGVQIHAYTRVPLAVSVYAVVAGWSAVLITLVLRRDAPPGWALAVDVAVTATGVVVLPLAVSNPVFDTLANPYLEPITVSVAAAVALVSGSPRHTAAGCATLAAAYVVEQVPLLDSAGDIASMVNVIGWQVGTAACCVVFIRRLRLVVRNLTLATQQVITARERLATQRAHTEARTRHFREQIRRYRALHDGPLRILTAIAGPGPAAHPDPMVRRQCAVSVDVLRGAARRHAGHRVRFARSRGTGRQHHLHGHRHERGPRRHHERAHVRRSQQHAAVAIDDGAGGLDLSVSRGRARGLVHLHRGDAGHAVDLRFHGRSQGRQEPDRDQQHHAQRAVYRQQRLG